VDAGIAGVGGVGVVSMSSQGVFGKQARPSGHSAEEPLGHGFTQVDDAS